VTKRKKTPIPKSGQSAGRKGRESAGEGCQMGTKGNMLRQEDFERGGGG